MKQFVIATAVIAVVVSCSPANSGYSIKGNITGDNPALLAGKAILENSDKTVSDTVDVINGKFEFKGKTDSPQQFYVNIPDVGRAVLYLENEKYRINTADTVLANQTVRAEGGTTNTIFKSLQDAINAKRAESGLEALTKEYLSPETSEERKQEMYDRLVELYSEVSEWGDSVTAKTISDHPHSLFALEQIPNSIYELEADSIKTLVAEYNADPTFSGNRTLEKINRYVEVLEATEVGKKALDFSMQTPKGKTVSLSDVYKGARITMIDFWASWCVPCRNANPTIVKVYDKYKKKGFEILGVSFDNNRDKWIEAIADDGLKWTNVSDLKGWGSAAGELYGIRYIPQNVFIDSEGTIIAKRIEPQEIEAFLAEKTDK